MASGRWIGAAAVALAVGTGTAVLLVPDRGPAAAPAAGPARPAATPPATTVPATTAAATTAAITLPRPTGPYPTGTTRLHLRDPGRVDPLDPRRGRRELMVQLWYPAAAGTGPLAPYAPAREAAALQAAYPVPAGAFTGPTNSRLDAPARPGRHPVVLYSHGLCGARTDNTAAAEQLASQGFVVAALGATHESPAVEFPGGRVENTSDPRFCAAGGAPFSAANQAILNRLLAVRVADSRFVLDELERLRRGAGPGTLPAGLGAGLDTGRVGMFGHSFGGGTAAAVVAADRRVVAGVDLDGFVVGPVARAGLREPFLVVGSSYHDMAFDRSWAAFLPRLAGWHRWFRLERAGHYRFIDLGGSVRKWDLESLRTKDPETWRSVFGDVEDRVALDVTTGLVGSFFDRFLLGRPAPVLDRPTGAHPELRDRTGTI